MSLRIIRHIEQGDTVHRTRASSMAIALILLHTMAFGMLLWGGHAELLNFYYPIASVIVAFWLYWETPALYIGFVWWIWFLTPFVRRIIDYQIGMFVDEPFSMVTPYLVVLLTLFTFFRFGRRLTNKLFLPFLLVLISIVYGAVIGFAHGVATMTVVLQLLEWITPVFLGFHMAVMWHEYPGHRSAIRTTFIWGVAVMGAYGIAQFFLAPPWDTLWMVGSKMTSIGKPEPTQIRVFSTLNAPGPFAMVMMAGLVLLFDGKGLFSRLMAAPGYGGYLLAMVRGSWGGWMLATMYLVYRLEGVLRIRLVYVLALGTILVVPLLLLGPVSSRLERRADTLSSLEEDGSFRARSALYGHAGTLILGNPVGNGFSKATFDSGIIMLFYVLGWFGAALYLIALLMLLRGALTCDVANTDQFTVVLTSIVIAFFVLLVASNQLTGVKGCVVWGFLGMTVASRLYYGSRRAG